MEDPNGRKRVRGDPEEFGLDSPEAKRLKDDLFDFLDDTDPAPLSQDLDFVMKSLQEEISASSSPAPVVDVTSDSGESQPQIGYLLEASDDELGLPPPGTLSNPEAKDEGFGNELVRVSSDSSGFGEFWDLDDRFPSYDSFEFGGGDSYNGNSEYVAFDGLFDRSDVYCDSGEFAESWRNDSLPTQ